MRQKSTHSRWVTLVCVLTASGLGLSQAGQQGDSLEISGYSGQAPLTQINGRSYVAVDALARLMHGSLAFQGNQTRLTLPNAQGTTPGTGQPAARGFSKDFLNAAIETLSDIREWRSTLLNAVENKYPVNESWMENYRAQAVKSLSLTKVAATTDSDRDALRLLDKEFNHMQELGSKVFAARKRLDYMTADTLKKDPLDQKILNCARSLAAMAASGEFRDDGSCN
jgi:hypothetical protein